MRRRFAGKSRKYQLFKHHRRPRHPRQPFPSKAVAQELAEAATGSDHVEVHRRHIPKKLVKYIERNTHVAFKKKPKFYTYKPAKGHRFRPKKQTGGWDGISATAYNFDSGKIDGTVVVLPESHLKDKDVKENVLLHELVETNIGQQLVNPKHIRRQQDVNNFEHGKFAMVYEKRDLDKRQLTRQDITNRAKKLFNEHMTKKQEE